MDPMLIPILLLVGGFACLLLDFFLPTGGVFSCIAGITIVAAIILGVIHSAWHLPIMDNYGTNFLTYTFNVVGLTIILNWFWFRSRGCVIPVMLVHAGTNVIGRYIPTPEDVMDGAGTFMVLRGIIYWILALVIIVMTKGSLGYSR